MSRKSVSYSIVDVFTAKRFAGNPVAVIKDAQGLGDDEMQAIAQEFGFSETTFLMSPINRASNAKVRIFTPFDEIPFAGHPNIGTAFVVGSEETAATVDGDELVFDEMGGPVSVVLQRQQERLTGARITAPQTLEVLGEVDPAVIADCLGLSIDQISSARIAPCVASVGLPFAFAEITNLTALEAIEPNVSAFKAAQARGLETVDGFAISAFVINSDAEGRFDLRARVFSPLGHPPEDPATGSAAGALTSLLAASSGYRVCRARIQQGLEIGRPSLIEVEVIAAEARAEITGNCVLVSSGELFL